MIFKSPHPDVVVPDMGITDYVLHRAAELGPQPALIDGDSGRALSYQELEEQIRQTAAGLIARGLRKGDVFAVCMPNLPEYPVAYHGIISAGGVVLPMNPMLTAGEISYVLKDSGARYLLTIPPLVEKAKEAMQQASVEELFVLGEEEEASSFVSLRDEGTLASPPQIDPVHDVAALPYSSGTSGLPKGVMLTHRNLVANIEQIFGAGHLPRTGDRLIAALPLAHIYPMQVVMNLGLRVGATLITMLRPDFPHFLELVQRYRINRVDVVPPMVLGLARHPLVDKYDLSSLEVVASAAAPLSAQQQQACTDRLGCVVKQCYGMTEAAPAVLGTSDDPSASPPGSVGPLLPNTTARIVDPVTGGPGEEGELLFRGPQMMKGYWNNRAATEATIDSEGWLHTGDIVRVDQEGNFYVVDRLKELIKFEGFQIAPAQLEAVLATHPAVADAAVVGVPQEEVGEVPKAYVVIREGQDPADEEIMSFVAERVAPYKKVRVIERVESIPRAPTGKILRRLLAEKERGKQERRSAGSRLEGARL